MSASSGNRFLPTMVEELDSELKGGLAPRTVTEVMVLKHLFHFSLLGINMSSMHSILVQEV